MGGRVKIAQNKKIFKIKKKIKKFDKFEKSLLYLIQRTLKIMEIDKESDRNKIWKRSRLS